MAKSIPVIFEKPSHSVSLLPGGWIPIKITFGMRCRILGVSTLGLPRGGTIVATIHSVESRGSTLRFIGLVEGGVSPGVLCEIDTGASKGTLHKTSADGIILKWVDPGVCSGALLTFPRQEEFHANGEARPSSHIGR